MKIKLLSIFFCLNLSACGFFPDKEKDYQLSTEIPFLVVPTDLSTGEIQKTKQVINQQPLLQENIDPKASEKVNLIKHSDGIVRIKIADSMDKSWRAVGKALSRNSIEITKRNEADKVYFIQYDPDFKKIEDGSLLDEARFIFTDDPAKEQEYRIKLVEDGAVIEVLILDIKNKPLATDVALKLLNLLYETIKADLADSE